MGPPKNLPPSLYEGYQGGIVRLVNKFLYQQNLLSERAGLSDVFSDGSMFAAFRWQEKHGLRLDRRDCFGPQAWRKLRELHPEVFAEIMRAHQTELTALRAGRR